MKRNSLVTILLVVLCFVACISQASAEVLLNETFDSGLIGNDINTLGWTKKFGTIVVSDNVIDSGNSGYFTGGWDWGRYERDFSTRTLVAGETAVLTWTAKNNWFGNYLTGGIKIADDLTFDYSYDYQGSGNANYVERVLMNAQNITNVPTDDRTASIKYKIELTNSSSKFYRDNGTGMNLKWEYAVGAPNAGILFFQNCGTVSYDNINYTILPLAPVPEPGSFVALGTGLVGLAGFVIRKRK